MYTESSQASSECFFWAVKSSGKESAVITDMKTLARIVAELKPVALKEHTVEPEKKQVFLQFEDDGSKYWIVGAMSFKGKQPLLKFLTFKSNLDDSLRTQIAPGQVVKDTHFKIYKTSGYFFTVSCSHKEKQE